MSPEDSALITEVVTEARKVLFERFGHRVRLIVKFITTVEQSEIEAVSVLYQDMCAVWGVSLEDLSRPFKGRHVSAMRHVLWFGAHTNFPQVPLRMKAKLLGRKEHTNVIHSLRQAKAMIDTNDDIFMSYYNPIKHLIHA